jgi:hypothetical protein
VLSVVHVLVFQARGFLAHELRAFPRMNAAYFANAAQLHWHMRHDFFNFAVELKDHRITRISANKCRPLR